ncbi:MAG: fatty acid CoA ligase family protein, partial [Candidatus Binatia bacterium]
LRPGGREGRDRAARVPLPRRPPARSTVSNGADHWNVASRLRETAQRCPDRLAVVCAAGRDGTGGARWQRLTFAELDGESDRVACGLERIGIGRGTRTVLMVPPGLDFFVATFALFKVGAVLVLVDPGIGRRNLGVCLGEAEPAAFVGVPLAHAGRLAFGWARASIRTVVTVGRRWGWGGPTLDELREGAGRAPQIAVVDRHETAGIFFTSGSTGVPKGVVYTHGIFAAQLEFLQEQFQPGDDDADLATFPPFALIDAVLGATAVIPEMDARRPASADPARLVEAILAHHTTRMFGSPALIDRLARHCESRGIRLTSIRRVLTAGAPVRGDIVERMSAVLPPDAEFHTPYGATEALPVTSIESREILTETRAASARGAGVCVGRPIRQVRVRVIRVTDEPIAAWSDDLVVPDGTIGEIVVEGAIVTPAYHARAASNALGKIRKADGGIVHRMGDVGWLDPGGRLWFCGRKAHRVETASGTLWPDPCEGIVNEHPAVFRSALVGVGPPGAQEPIICLELERRAGRAERARIASEVLALCAAHEPMRAIRRVLFHRAFPVDRRHNAKIDRPALARWAARRLG